MGLAPWLDSTHGYGIKVIGGHANPNNNVFDTLLIMLNFKGYDV